MTIKLHHLRPAPGSKSTKIRVGRGEGGKRGKTAGRGTKGTGARKNVPARFEGGQMPLQMRLPKLKGFTNPNRVEFQVVNLRDIERLFPEGGQVGIADLIAKGAVRKNEPVKVLGDGKLTVKVDVSVNKFTGSAKEKIAAAGGSARYNPDRLRSITLIVCRWPQQRASVEALAAAIAPLWPLGRPEVVGRPVGTLRG